ncbi:type III polyketide synthase [Aurantiacibacter luteus]|uniref:Stilbene synthase n=1 Tax=Aurantiacibacter luteus TaxID=1581420 RepID=A0A0G9MYE9_9SPHN|nr:type III polyketide synthase [Aurantiacibacter luteus]KLE35802.1 hypothetical protein AAW00_05355 [Aurantiacibacter luteus]
MNDVTELVARGAIALQPQGVPRINALGTATPSRDAHASYNEYAARQIADPREEKLFRRMTERGGIDHRYSVLEPADIAMEAGSFYDAANPTGTAGRMRRYAAEAPELALAAIDKLPDLAGITHIVVASCTGFMAPGLDQVIARRLGLSPSVERVSIGFMGCYAGITLLRTAGHIVRGNPAARVLAVSVELCSLHLQDGATLEQLLAMGQFADGAAAALVTGSGPGLVLGEGLSAALEDSGDLITWTIGETGFVMHLSGAVPGRLAEALADERMAEKLRAGGEPDAWAVHPGGKSILDAVERGLHLPADALDTSRAVLREVGNMSSATVLFVIQRMMEQRPRNGLALAFGPGLAMEGVRFHWDDGE